NLSENDKLLKPLALHDSDTHVAMISKKGRMLVIALDEIKQLTSGGKGTILMGLDDGDSLAQWISFGEQGLQASGIYRNKETVLELPLSELVDYVGKRARKGKILSLKIKQPKLSAVRENTST